MHETKCPLCFPNGQSGDCNMYASVPNGDGTYTTHLQRSVYTDHYDRDCPWQQKDHEDRVKRLETGVYS